MKIAFVTDMFYPSIGGTQMLCKCIADFFFKNNNEIEILTTLDYNRDLNSLPYKVMQFDSLDFRQSHVFKNNDYDHVFVLADMFSHSLMSIKFDQIKKSTVILNLDENVYNWIKNEENGFNKSAVAKLTNQLKSATNVVSFCQGAPVNKFLDEEGIKYHFIPNFSRDIKNSKLNLNIKEKLNLNNKKIIFNHGNIEYRKNQLQLIKAFLSSDLPNEYALVLLGSPRSAHDMEYLKHINSVVSKNKDKVFLLKGTNRMDIVDCMLQQSDVFVLPSLAEGLPLVLLEAMSAGLPWISTPCGGVPGVLGNMTSGIIFSNFSIDAPSLEAAVKSVEGKNSRKDWEENFTEQACCSKYMGLL